MRTQFQSGIELAKTSEIDAIFNIEQKCFPGKVGYSKGLLEYLMLNANSTCLVEKQDGVIRGFLIIIYRRGSLTCNIETIDVDPAFKNKGIGLRLLEAAEIYMKEKGMKFSQLEVSEGNEAAFNLYKKVGYSVKERIEGYYQFEHNGTCNALRMLKPL
jgi:ribosomal protein S18 acetylase RimI-like enzyme